MTWSGELRISFDLPQAAFHWLGLDFENDDCM